LEEYLSKIFDFVNLLSIIDLGLAGIHEFYLFPGILYEKILLKITIPENYNITNPY
jgi:hypothetical protein